jgi:hypothetical protein
MHLRTAASTLGAALLLFAALLACRGGARGSGSKLEYGSEDDVEKLLARGGVTTKVSDCENVRYADAGGTTLRDNGVTRALSCFTTLTTAQSTTLVSGLALHAAKPSTSSGPMRTGTCGARGFVVGATGFDAWEARGRPPSASGFEYVMIVVESATGRTCVELEYAWS